MAVDLLTASHVIPFAIFKGYQAQGKPWRKSGMQHVKPRLDFHPMVTPYHESPLPMHLDFGATQTSVPTGYSSWQMMCVLPNEQAALVRLALLRHLCCCTVCNTNTQAEVISFKLCMDARIKVSSDFNVSAF